MKDDNFEKWRDKHFIKIKGYFNTMDVRLTEEGLRKIYEEAKKEC